MTLRNILVGLAVFMALAAGAGAQELEFTVGDLEIDHPWARASKGRASSGAVFMEVKNTGKEMDRLIGGSTPVAETVKVYASWPDKDGRMKPRDIGAMEIHAGSEFDFEPDGVFLYLGGLKGPLIEGERFPLTLNFERAGPVEVEVEIESADAVPGHKH